MSSEAPDKDDTGGGGGGAPEDFTNPLPPEGHVVDFDEPAIMQKLSNEDFRKMITTSSVRSKKLSLEAKHAGSKAHEDSDKKQRRLQRKKYYAKLKRLEQENETELAQKYRDRAKERRDGKVETNAEVPTTADYRSVAPNTKVAQTYTEQRKLAIQESKYLGGDMEHTHLVKGLDYALLDKVRAEITSKEEGGEEDEEDVIEEEVKKKKKEIDEDEAEKALQFRSKMARRVE